MVCLTKCLIFIQSGKDKYMSGTKVEAVTSKKRLRTEAASEQHRKNKRVRKTTERTLLQQLVSELDKDGSVLQKISASLLAKAEAGDKDALAFIGKLVRVHIWPL